jgi:gluconokinase
MAASAGRVKLSQAVDPLVLAVDIGSTASRGDVFDAAGRPVQGGREKVPHHFTTRDDGTSEIDPDQIVGEVQQIITALATDRRAGRIGGVALDTFASSLVGVGADRGARTPCFTYADSRCAAQVAELTAAGRAGDPTAHRMPAARKLSDGATAMAARHDARHLPQRSPLDVAR